MTRRERLRPLQARQRAARAGRLRRRRDPARAGALARARQDLDPRGARARLLPLAAASSRRARSSRRWSSAHPVNDYAHFCLGRALEKTGRRSEARRHAALAASMRPDRATTGASGTGCRRPSAQPPPRPRTAHATAPSRHQAEQAVELALVDVARPGRSACTQMSRDARAARSAPCRVWRFHHRSIQGSSRRGCESASAWTRSRPSASRRPTSSGQPPACSAGTVRPHSAWASRRRRAGQRVQVGVDRRRPRPSPAGYGPRVRALVQRVSEASVTVDGETVARDRPRPARAAGRAPRRRRATRRTGSPRKLLRAAGLRGRRRADEPVGRATPAASCSCVSQFTLYGDTRKGNRPSFVEAAPPEEAEPLYERVRDALGAQGGAFGARMAVELVNDGPVTLLVET